MKEVRLPQLHIPQLVRRLLPVVPVALGLVAVAAADQGTLVAQPPSAAASNSMPSPTLSPQVSPVNQSSAGVSVNGQPVSVNAEGSGSVQLSDGTRVDVNRGSTTVSTTGGPSSGSSGGNNNVNVNINSGDQGGSGTSWSSTQTVGGNADTNGNSTSFSSTNVFSTSSTTNESSSE